MNPRRTRSITTKVTPEEYERFTTLAESETMSEWVRAVLLRATSPTSCEVTLLAELLALRTILLNLHFALSRGEPPTPDAMQRIIDRADSEKHEHACDRLRKTS